jgi:hypothetical protein
MTLIEELYSSKAVSLIQDLYSDDPSSRSTFYQTFGHKILESREKILLSEPLNILMFICSTASFSSSPEESQQVAIITYKRFGEANPLPYVLDDRGITLAEKCLVSLSFFYPAMVKRWKKGGPSPEFYRDYSKRIFESEGYYEIAEHHEQWERFFTEFFV